MPSHQILDTWQSKIDTMIAASGDKGASEDIALVRDDSAYLAVSRDLDLDFHRIVPLEPGFGIATIETTVQAVLRLRARNSAIKAAGAEGDPAWSIEVHTAIAAALRHNGLAEVIKRHPSKLSGNLSKRVRASGAAIKSGRLTFDAFEVHTPTGKLLLWSRTPPETGIRIMGKTVPQMVLKGIRGKRLGDVLQAEEFDTCRDLEIADARLSNDRAADLLLILEDRYEPLEPVPEGIDDKWLRMPI